MQRDGGRFLLGAFFCGNFIFTTSKVSWNFTFIEGLRHGCGRALTIDGDDVQYAIGIGKKFELIFDL